MRKALLMLLATFVVLGVVGTGHAYAADLGELYWEDDYKDAGKTVRVWDDGRVSNMDVESMTHRQNRNYTLSIDGQTLHINGECWEEDLKTVTIYVSTPDDGSEFAQAHKQYYTEKESFTGTTFSIDVDIEPCVDVGSLRLRISYGEPDDDEFYFDDLTPRARPTYVNGEWKFMWSGTETMKHNAFMMHTSPFHEETYWKYMDEEKSEQWIRDSKNLHAIKVKSDSLTQGITDPYIKAYLIYSWVSCTFDYGDNTPKEGIKAPFNCAGYCELMCNMMYYARIPCTLLGSELTGELHGSNRAWIDGRWIMLDGVWDNDGYPNSGSWDMSLETYTANKYVIMGNESCKTDTIFKKPEEKPANAVVTTHNVVTFMVNGYPMPRSVGAYNIGGNNYVKLRDLATLMNTTSKKFSVNWDNASQSIAMQTGANYTAVGGELFIDYAANKPSPLRPLPWGLKCTSSVYLNGKQLNLTAYNILENNYFKLRDVAQAMNFGVSYDGATKMITLNASKAYTN